MTKAFSFGRGFEEVKASLLVKCTGKEREPRQLANGVDRKRGWVALVIEIVFKQMLNGQALSLYGSDDSKVTDGRLAFLMPNNEVHGFIVKNIPLVFYVIA
ncbi:hypothetical protein QC825_02465 [Larsenimonas suaedae]|uniref:Uncharacterized protein n=1 Tax=Larsenimonas suaedae TaxID=1851019 RepID=A0ABU1GSD1_9GAMM|nr:hypothetical protein [Larsenimonas suaedae]MCM2972266.1 hypothetical protein [Larsenimonas suaedae]MDR5894938.1 hypothetical protein [Larsenimonas suaedae]